MEQQAVRNITTDDGALTLEDVERIVGERVTLLTETQLARLLSLSRSWFQQARARGDGPQWIKLGHAVRYPLATVNQWLEHRRTPNSIEHSPKATTELAWR